MHPDTVSVPECVRGRGLQHEMKMIRHETEAQEPDWILGLGRLQQSQERRVVAVLGKDAAPPLPRFRT
jgi:hypothetical protein